ncbi:MAG: PGF-pre-PGF domain-containing protein, partial [Candidatus Hadarchaeales archaeon]
TSVGDHDGNGIPDILLGFSFQALTLPDSPGILQLSVIGFVKGLEFKGTTAVLYTTIPENLEPIIVTLEDLHPGTRTVFLENISLNRMDITLENYRERAGLFVLELFSPPEGIPPVPGIVYRYLLIIVENLEEVENVSLTFAVSRSWISSSNISENLIFLKRFNASENIWENIPITLVGEDESYVYFRANLRGFSLFAISGLPAAAPKPEAKPRTEILIAVIVVIIIILLFILISLRRRQ